MNGLNNLKRNKMTAVEWLVKQLPIYGYNVVKIFPELLEQAKEMEKKQGYSEEEVIDIAKQAFVLGKDFGLIGTFNEWFEQFKKK